MRDNAFRPYPRLGTIEYVLQDKSNLSRIYLTNLFDFGEPGNKSSTILGIYFILGLVLNMGPVIVVNKFINSVVCSAGSDGVVVILSTNCPSSPGDISPYSRINPRIFIS